MRTSTLRQRRRRGSVMIEFAIVLPLFLFFILFSIDAGRLMLLRAQLQDATQQAARAGAQVGGAEVGGITPSRSAFDRAIEYAPSLEASRVTQFQIVGPPSRKCGTGSAVNTHVTIRTEYRAALVTPGLEALLRISARGVSVPGDGWILSAVSTARCEVVVP